jgi:SAM-dependent methyltransferase
MNRIACPICNNTATLAFSGKQWKSELLGKTYSYGQCYDCQFLFCSPALTKHDLEKVYEKYPADRFFLRVRLLKEIQGIHRYQRIKKILKETNKTGSESKLLDVGCSYGWFLKAARRNGWDVSGVDIMGDRLVSDFKIDETNILSDSFEAAQIPYDYYDLVTMWHFLEHVQDPRIIFDKLSKILKTGDLGIIAVPNYSSKGLEKNGSRWNWLGEPYVHVACFSLTSIEKLLPEDLIIVDVKSRDTYNGQFLQTLILPKVYVKVVSGIFDRIIRLVKKSKLPGIAAIIENIKIILIEINKLFTYALYLFSRRFLKRYENVLKGSELLIVIQKSRVTSPQ